jgi:hypothetical protein
MENSHDELRLLDLIKGKLRRGVAGLIELGAFFELGSLAFID